MEIKIGDIIKSYDFAYNTECYSIGMVTDIAEDLIFFTCVRQVWEGEVVHPSSYEPRMVTPVMGSLLTDAKFQRLEVI